MCNKKQRDDEMGQNTLHCCYGGYGATNQQTSVNETCYRDFASLPCHLVFKDLLFSKLIICCWISLSLQERLD